MPSPSTDSDQSASELQRLLFADGMIRDPDAMLTPLAGGVSSEIYRVDDGGRRFVVKRALPKLKVAQEWFADIRRNGSEAAYLSYVHEFCPDHVPRLLHFNRTHGYLCMEYLDASFRNWKQMMLDGQCDVRIATDAGSLLGAIHARSLGDFKARDEFQTVENFEQLRIEPYLLATARRHPQLRGALEGEAARLRAARDVLTHGDFSPKNILVSRERVVVVDCEVAWYGDAAFDVAFLLSHLFLKSLARPQAGNIWRRMIGSAWLCYCDARAAGDGGFRAAVLDAQVCRLTAMLMLARIDGKSPVEYLQDSQKEEVRIFIVQRLQRRPIGLMEFTDEWLSENQVH